jgi:hypothetical protein
MLREYKHRHAIVRGKKWDKIILCEICVGPTGHISDKTSMTQHVKTDIGLDRHGESTGRIIVGFFYFCQYLHIGAGILSFGGDVFRL